MRLLVTRPEPDGERTAQRLRARGHAVLQAALLRIETRTDAELGPGPWDAVVMTSANAARAIARHARCGELRTLPVFVVGRHAGEAAHAAGFARVESADGDVRDLTRRIARLSPARLLYLAGEDRAGNLPAELGAAGFVVDPIIVYRAVVARALPEHVRAALTSGNIDGVLHFSPRSAAAFVAATAGLGQALALAHFCLSGEVAKPLAAAGAHDLRVAPRPDEMALLQLIGPA